MNFKQAIQDLNSRKYTVHRAWDDRFAVVETPSGFFRRLEWMGGVWTENSRTMGKTVHVLETEHNNEIVRIQTLVA